jgi:hypothetical protein
VYGLFWGLNCHIWCPWKAERKGMRTTLYRGTIGMLGLANPVRG